MSATSELSIRNDGHLIDIAPSPTTGINQSGGGGEIHTEWLRELTSASRSAAVLNDLIGRTPTLWYLGERAPTILRPRSRRADLKALHAVRAVAIGPYHRGDRGLAFDDEAKLPFLRYLQDQCGLDVEQYVAALGVARHRTRRARRWCGDLILHFLPSPWVSVSLAAVVALIIVPAMLQTIYAILGYQK
ncbi:hypothetical protein VPH35_047353 [Triticum aestivum]|uniref:uncharacterized protein n=1 Tax=Triticum aestivum TaxID=4565 RepID=UPI00162B284F|nr:uncharacterized protein LOC123059207 [Triticum aestivum]